MVARLLPEAMPFTQRYRLWIGGTEACGGSRFRLLGHRFRSHHSQYAGPPRRLLRAN